MSRPSPWCFRGQPKPTTDAMHEASSPSRGRIWSRAPEWTAFGVSVATFSLQLGSLGFYHDDWPHLILPYAAYGDDLFWAVFSDLFGHLYSTRPLLYVALAANRAALLAGPAAMHLLAAAVHLAVALTLVRLCRLRVPDSPTIAMATGALFAVYPIAPVIPAWASPLHHVCSALATAQAMLFIERWRRSGKRGVLLAASVAAYATSLLFTEGFLAVTPAFVVMSRFIEPRDGRPWALRARLAGALKAVAPFAGLLVLWFAWRQLVVPLYSAGFPVYHESLGVDLRRTATKGLSGLYATLNPWPTAALRLVDEGNRSDVLVGLAAAVLASVTIAFAPARRAARAFAPAPALELVVIGAAMALAGVLPAATSGYPTIQLTGITSRVLFPAQLGASLFAAGLLVLAARLCLRRPSLWQPAGAILLGTVGVALAERAFGGGGRMSGRAQYLVDAIGAFPAFGSRTMAHLEYRLLYPLGPYLVALGLLVFAALLVGRWCDRRSRFSAARGLFAVACGALVLLGSVSHLAEQRRLASAWKHHRLMVRRLVELVPAVRDGTFFVLDDATENRLVLWRFHDVSSLLLAIYGNPTVLGTFGGALGARQGGLGPLPAWPTPADWRSERHVGLLVLGPPHELPDLERVLYVRIDDGSVELPARARFNGGDIPNNLERVVHCVHHPTGAYRRFYPD